jgi:copper chaperone CopZ
MDNKKLQEVTYFVQGMHCASCEILIEKELLNLKGIKFVEASTSKKKVLIGYEGKRISLEYLNNIFKKSGYIFSDKQNSSEKNKIGRAHV